MIPEQANGGELIVDILSGGRRSGSIVRSIIRLGKRGGKGHRRYLRQHGQIRSSSIREQRFNDRVVRFDPRCLSLLFSIADRELLFHVRISGNGLARIFFFFFLFTTVRCSYVTRNYERTRSRFQKPPLVVTKFFCKIIYIVLCSIILNFELGRET